MLHPRPLRGNGPDFHVDQIIAGDRPARVDHVQIAEGISSLRVDLEGVKRVPASLRSETSDPATVHGPVYEVAHPVKDLIGDRLVLLSP
jgi:hypothetical protein